jgi:hypothetical protein
MKNYFTATAMFLSVFAVFTHANMDLKDDYLSHKLTEGQDSKSYVATDKDNHKNDTEDETVFFKYKTKHMSECPKDVSILTLANECDDCGSFEVSIRKHSTCCSDGACTNKKENR